MGAEAAAVAASKKVVPANINTTNPLLSEKVNSPAAGTPTKSKADPSGILSPRNVPLPETPKPGLSNLDGTFDTSHIPSPTQKGIKLPPSMHVDAANPALDAGPISVSNPSPSLKSPSIKSPPITSPVRTSSSDSGIFHGSKVENATEEEIKRVEKEQAIQEVSSSDEEDDEDEEIRKKKKADVDVPTIGTKAEDTAKSGQVAAKPAEASEAVDEDDDEDDDDDEDEEEEDDEDDDDDDEDDDDQDEDEDEPNTIAKPQAQDAKAGDKAGDSVKD
jgi:hypothetical protein